MSKPAAPREFWIRPAKMSDEEDVIFHEDCELPKEFIHVIEATPTTTAASEMLEFVEFACRVSNGATSSDENIHMGKRAYELLARIAAAEGQS